jgi:hypothetical protein
LSKDIEYRTDEQGISNIEIMGKYPIDIRYSLFICSIFPDIPREFLFFDVKFFYGKDYGGDDGGRKSARSIVLGGLLRQF